MERNENESNLRLTYRPDLDILFLRWLRYPTSAQLRQGYMEALELAVQEDCRFWLFDLRSRGSLSVEDEAWMLKTYFPGIEERLPYQNYFANLVTPTHYTYIQEHIGLSFLSNYGNFTKLGIFLSEQDAVAWLLKCRSEETDQTI
ncbi:hypothetical protein [Rufibacter immobilis]|uniref:hypothetical protein n=1 Tax=Rufibacter immobilis TaxID=1348778 RepID=UPI0035EF8E90